MTQGKFITFEGGEGSGKSTQCRRLFSYLQSQGQEVVLTREPGGSSGAEAIRPLLVQDHGIAWDGMTEVLLQFAARRENLCETVWPALQRGAWVICDRFVDSTFAYQGGGWEVPFSVIDTLYALTVGNFTPHLTFLLDVPVPLGLERAGHREKGGPLEHRYEALGLAFHERVRQVFQTRAQKEPRRFVVLDGSRSPEEVERDIVSVMDSYLSLPKRASLS
jgi:dTMP kinase